MIFNGILLWEPYPHHHNGLFSPLLVIEGRSISVLYEQYEGTSGGVTVSKLDLLTYTSEFESHWAPHTFGLVPHRSKELCKLLYEQYEGTSGGVTVSKLDLLTYTSEFESHWAPHTFGLVPHRSKELCKLLYEQYETSYLFYITLSFLCNIICYLISVFVFSLVTLSEATQNRYQPS